MKVFIDTSAFIALLVKSETYHSKVSQKYKEYRRQRSGFYTSYYVLDELFTRLMYDFGKAKTQTVIKSITESIAKEELICLAIDGLVFKKSQEVFMKFAEHKISFTDATTFMLFKNYKLDEIFTLDSDFKKMRLATSF